MKYKGEKSSSIRTPVSQFLEFPTKDLKKHPNSKEFDSIIEDEHFKIPTQSFRVQNLPKSLQFSKESKTVQERLEFGLKSSKSIYPETALNPNSHQSTNNLNETI